MEKYIGNKTALLPLIGEYIEQRIPDANSISDLFTGTTNVARFFRRRDFDVAVGDLNRFSYILAHAYVGLREYVPFEGQTKESISSVNLEKIQLDFLRSLKKQDGIINTGDSAKQMWTNLKPLAHTLAHLQDIGDSNTLPGLITEHYTQWGSKSQFLSVRGTTGKRNYFSKENALFLDGVLETVRRWFREGQVSRNELFLILTSIIEEVVITANVNGTFHDFNRNRIWPNANQKFFLRLPFVATSKGRFEVANDDAISAAKYIRPHDICYVDPPYNFRQYTSYYHFLNFIAGYPFYPSPQEYLDNISFVRGQHKEDDHPSQFCYRDSFIDKLKELFMTVDSRYVVMSYFGGRNHWNHWSKASEPTDMGLNELKRLFADKDLFQDCEVVPALDIRRNYQSRIGEQKGLVNEYLFLGVRNSRPRPPASSPVPLPANVAVGISEHFSYVFTPREKNRKGADRAVSAA